MKLYIGSDTCARAAQLVANELGVKHELVYVDVFTKATSNGEDFATVNPLLYVPVLKLDNFDHDIISETIVISSYLADQHPESVLLPPPGTLERVKADQFLVQMTTEMIKGRTGNIGAAQWLFNTIKTGIQDIINYISFLFEWDNIKRTKDVLHNLVRLYLQDQINQLPAIKQSMDGQLANMESTINNWAGITDWSPLGDVTSKPASGISSNPAGQQTSGSSAFGTHFTNNVSNSSVVGAEAAIEVAQDLADLVTNILSMSIGDDLKRLRGYPGRRPSVHVQVVTEAVFDLIVSLADTILTLLDTQIHIHIISDILNAIGIPDISFLDLICWVAAVPYTIIYKIADNAALFPNNSYISALISATNWSDVQNSLTSPSNNVQATKKTRHQVSFYVIQDRRTEPTVRFKYHS
ncbi:hypothetical protein HDV63DRAFT_412128 [Trichoderma sp. SZMC 28014]